MAGNKLGCTGWGFVWLGIIGAIFISTHVKSFLGVRYIDRRQMSRLLETLNIDVFQGLQELPISDGVYFLMWVTAVGTIVIGLSPLTKR